MDGAPCAGLTHDVGSKAPDDDDAGPLVTSHDDTIPAPGSLLLIRDEEWLVTRSERASDGAWFVTAQGVSELVRDTTAIFSSALDDVQVLDPADARVVADDSPAYRRSRLWLESMVRKTA